MCMDAQLLMCWFLRWGLLCSAITPQEWTPIVVKDITSLGPQLDPDVTNVSRDGGYSALINGNIVWLYDDTECFDSRGKQLSFVSNTAAYGNEPNRDISRVVDFGVVQAGYDHAGGGAYAILPNISVGGGGWIPFQADEIDSHRGGKNGARVAIWPGTSPMPISITQSVLLAPLVYIDPSKEYQTRGMALITITAPASGPIAVRQGEITVSGNQVAFGGFSTVLGFSSAENEKILEIVQRDVYLLGTTPNGLQIARVGLDDINNVKRYTYFNPEELTFSTVPPRLGLKDEVKIYLPGSFTSGSIFYSSYFGTFVLIYFNNLADSTFYIRYLNLDNPLGSDSAWVKGGKNGGGIEAEDAEALIRYAWSPEQKLYASTPGKGGFNYAGTAHPEYFNRQYYPKSLYPETFHQDQRENAWYGSGIVTESDAGGDGKYLLLSWTSQIQEDKAPGIYQVQLAVVQFDDIPAKPGATTPPWPLPSNTKHKSMAADLHAMPQGWFPAGNTLGSMLSHNSRDEFSGWRIAWKSLLLLLCGIALGALIP